SGSVGPTSRRARGAGRRRVDGRGRAPAGGAAARLPAPAAHHGAAPLSTVVSYLVEPMQLDDVDEVSRVERECFTTPWPVNAYRRELRENRLSRYVVARWLEAEPGGA